MPILQIVAGLYYALGSILLIKKLSGDVEYDVVMSTGGGRPTLKAADVAYGFNAFQGGLHSPQRIPDSGWAGTDHGAWTIKMPWEIHLKRNVPPPNLYDMNDPY